MLLLENLQIIQQRLSHNFTNDRLPFYFISTISLFVAIVLSLASTFTMQENYSDFFPTGGYYYDKYIHDYSYVDKICWYFSQITHHTLFLLFSYFFLALINRRSESFFKMVAPLAFTISVLYFYLLFPKQNLKIHQLSYSNFFSHFMIIFLIIGEFYYIKDYTFKETTHCFILIMTCLCAIFINYTLRGVWSYNLVKLDRFSGWSLVSKTTIVMYLFSVMFFVFKYGKKRFMGLNTQIMRKSTLFFSGLLNMIFFHIFVYYDKIEKK